MKRSDLIDYDTYRQIYLDDEPESTEETMKKDYKEFLESDDFENIFRLMGALQGMDSKKVEENLESVKKK